MKNTITNAAELTVLTLIDQTYKTGGGPVSRGACVVMAPKGLPMTPIKVRNNTWEDLLGAPYHNAQERTQMEGLRHVADAARECDYINVVRVVAADAMFPYLSTALSDGAITAGASAYGTTMALGVGEMLRVWPIDGDPSANRSFFIDNVSATKKRFDITFYDKDSTGTEYELESYTVGVSPTDTDDMGAPAYIVDALENKSDRFRCAFDGSAWDDIQTALAAAVKTVFAGGTNGGTPTTQDWKDAWDIFRNEQIAADLMFAAGNYDTDVISNCMAIAKLRHNEFYFDAPPYLDHAAAITWLTDAGFANSRFSACYYCPASAKDSWYGGRTIWGVSGAIAAAKAIGNANFTGAVPGVHYAPAGDKRAKLTRTGGALLFPTDILDRDALYDARINPVISGTDGGLVVDDELSVHYEENYSRFIHVASITNYIDHRFLQMAAQAKFEPDGITRPILERGMRDILDDCVTSGALVPARDPEFNNGNPAPYTFTVTQQEIDLWLVEWNICPTGSARRIAGQPRLIK